MFDSRPTEQPWSWDACRRPSAVSTLHLYVYSIYSIYFKHMCHRVFVSCLKYKLPFHHECSSHCVPALLHSSSVFLLLHLPGSFFPNNLICCIILLHHLLFPSSFCLVFFSPPFLLSPVVVASLFSVCVHMCVFSPFSSLASRDVDRELPTSCYVCDMF